MKLVKKDPHLPVKTKVMSYFLDALFEDKEAWNALTKWQPDFLDEESRRYFECIKEENVFQEIDLTVEEHRVISGLFTLYTKYNYPIEGVVTSWANFWRACGVEPILKRKRKSIDFPGRETKKLFWALLHLERKLVSILYKRRNFSDPTKGELTALRNEPLCKFLRLYYRLSDEEIKRLPEKYRKLYIEKREKGEIIRLVHLKLNPILIEDPSYYRIHESNIYERLKELKGKKRRISRYDFNFFYWMLRQTKVKVEIDPLKLAKIIKVSESTIKKWANYIRELLKEIYEDFKALGYITHYELDVPAISGGYKDVIHLNPEKLTHLRTEIVKK